MKISAQELATIIVFSSLDLNILVRLATAATVQAYKKGEIIIHEGDRFPPKFHAVLDGYLVAQKIAPSGKETTLRQLSAGELFAAPALFGDGIAPATVTALTASQIVTIPKTDLLNTIQAEPDVALQILQCFNQRLQEMHQTIHGLISERAVVRLARLIQYMAHRYGVERTSEGSRLQTKLPHQQLARMIGITYEESVRLIKKDLASIIRYDRGGMITIQDDTALDELVN